MSATVTRPMRYAWNMSGAYAPAIGKLKLLVFILTMHYLRLWDNAASSRVDYFIANSHNVRRRIWKYYRRDAKVIFPPCDVDRFSISDKIEDYYLLVSRLVPYKRVDLAVRAFSENGRRLVVVGSGPEESSLKSIAGKNIEFLGWLDDEAMPALYAGCRALVFPGEEDFGIVPVEAQCAGRPVIAYGRGGALETVLPEKTGIFFQEQTVEALNEAVRTMEPNLERFDPQVIRAHAETFSPQVFRQEMRSHIVRCLEDHKRSLEDHAPPRSQ
jgi:glycosyltransferase involved in cell wall biosynthesis